jgi:predicted enzyme related to lactoylglutathione lyase
MSFGVDEADAALARLDGLGGTVVEPGEGPVHGRIATVAHPTGVDLGTGRPSTSWGGRR